MPVTCQFAISLAFLLVIFPVRSSAQALELRNANTTATFDRQGLTSVKDIESNTRVDLARDAWSLTIDNTILRSGGSQPVSVNTRSSEVSYEYEISGYRIQVTYSLAANWKFVSKQITVLRAPGLQFTVHKVVPWDLTLRNAVKSDYVASAYVPQLGETIEQSRTSLPAKDFGGFLRFSDDAGAMVTVQNPFLTLQRNGQGLTIAYEPEMEWKQAWGTFSSDKACLGAYHLSGRRMPREMALEWHPAPTQTANDGMDQAEIVAFTDCVRAFLIGPAPAPISVEVGWTLNDYQIDVGTPGGESEYKRIIDASSELGIQTLIYGPGNSALSDRTQSADSWCWEYVLWLNMGEKIRKGEWDPTKDAIPASVTDMVSYARQKHVGLLAYVYPSVPYAANPSWLVKRAGKDNDSFTYATLASRELQDYLTLLYQQ